MSYSTTDTYQMKREILNFSNKISRKLSKPKRKFTADISRLSVFSQEYSTLRNTLTSVLGGDIILYDNKTCLKNNKTWIGAIDEKRRYIKTK